MSLKKVELSYRVPYADTDQMKVVYYANYLVYFERLRNELIRASGIPYTQVEESGIAFPVLEVKCEYLKPARYDDELQILGWVSWIQGGRFQIDYDIQCRGETLVTGYTIHAAVSHEGRPRRVPEAMKSLAPEGSPSPAE